LPIVYRLQRVTHSHDAVWLPAQRQRKKASPLSSLRNSPELACGKEWPSFASLSPAWEHHLGPPLAAQHKLSRRSLGPLPPSRNSSSSSRALPAVDPATTTCGDAPGGGGASLTGAGAGVASRQQRRIGSARSTAVAALIPQIRWQHSSPLDLAWPRSSRRRRAGSRRCREDPVTL